jgi:glycine oxidase
MRDVVVVGGGVIGLSVAFELARDGVSVTVLERGDFGREASWAGAGILPPGVAGAAGDPLIALAALSHRLWPEWTSELQELTGIDNGYLRCGGLCFVPGDESNRQSEIDAWRSVDVEASAVSGEALRKIEPLVDSRWNDQIYELPTLAQVRNPRHLRALVVACGKSGVELRPGQQVVDFEKRGGRVCGIRTATERFEAGIVVIAGGAWSGELCHHAGAAVAVQPVRGQIVLLQAQPLPFRRVLECGPRYVVPRPDGRILIGSTEEHVGFQKANTAGAIAELIEFGASLSPTLKEARFERAWSGLRPKALSDRPILGQVRDAGNVFVATGHFRSGLTLSAATGRVMAQLVTGRPTDVPLEGFA